MAEDLINLYKLKGFGNIELRKDLQGKENQGIWKWKAYRLIQPSFLFPNAGEQLEAVGASQFTEFSIIRRTFGS